MVPFNPQLSELQRVEFIQVLPRNNTKANEKYVSSFFFPFLEKKNPKVRRNQKLSFISFNILQVSLMGSFSIRLAVLGFRSEQQSPEIFSSRCPTAPGMKEPHPLHPREVDLEKRRRQGHSAPVPQPAPLPRKQMLFWGPSASSEAEMEVLCLDL